ncbi:poly(A)-specific ribonuclease PARN-like domain-containing protein 1 isoform X2 [Pseudomyrmex gracilis]|uniref:poly(A)-specific ribonuclease PARN-like domain-containing protein 1 isoform X2 n=1 Tax=Pseudomyrmex gracilis TaxID=219809 RepID=UPI0009949168|nr:poly(A)-specific ribonuclease PARN-like domain-containing protein 1 isoform X2 [Pseudomyrmex gracilis]
MIDVTSHNFAEVYPHLERALKDASFIAIDTELTGLEVDAKISLFDSINERYEKQKRNIEPHIIIQFGICTFQRVQHENKYTAEIFNFFLLPKNIPSMNRSFVWQVAALEFLSKHGFDFNELMYNGISYLNESEEAFLQQQLQNNMLFHNLRQSLSFEEEDDLNSYINQVAEWLKTADEVNLLKVVTPTPLLQYIAHKELRNYFPNVWTTSGNNVVTVMKVLPGSREVLQNEEGSILENAILDLYAGFSKIFKLLVTLKKPLIAHNAFLDLMFMHQQFYRPLPKNYIDYKTATHKMFPKIYDTKFLSFRLKELLDTEVQWKRTSLGDLFEYFTRDRGKYIDFGSPDIILTSKLEKSDVTSSPKYHNAGWDSYFAGYVFIRMAHIFAKKQYGQSSALKEYTHTELMNSVKDFANCVNVIRGDISHLRLDGPEPESTRPNWLYVKPLSSRSISASQIAEKMSVFGTVDVKQYTSKRVLVAVTNHGRMRLYISEKQFAANCVRFRSIFQILWYFAH